MGSRAVAGVFDLVSHPAYGVTKRSHSANLHRKLQSLREGMEAFSLSFPFLPCSWSLMQSASTSRVFTIYTVHYLTVQDYFHYWDWQAASCQDRTGVFFSVSLNELSFFWLNTLTLDWGDILLLQGRRNVGSWHLCPQIFISVWKFEGWVASLVEE